jgi:cyanophycin synthetase
LGPSTKAILEAAEKRSIPFRRLNTGSLVVMGFGANQLRIWTAESDRTGAIAESIAQDKELTKRLLRAVGVPVPEGRAVDCPDDAVDAASDIESAVVVKPQDANHGRGIVPNLTQAEEIRNAYHVAAKEGSGVIVERFVPGYEHRLLVVGDKFVAASKGEPVTVAGDGRRTVQQLVEEVVNADPRRGEDETLPLSPVEIDQSLRMILEHQGLTLESVPALGKPVLVKRHDNLSHDVTDLVHPSVAENAVLAAKTVGLDIAGIDIVALDISCPLEDQGGAIVEVNAGPGLIMHLKPLVGSPRPVGQAIVDMMFGPEGDARIPILCVTGTSGTLAITRTIQQALAARDFQCGLANRQGTFLNERSLSAEPSDNAAKSRDMLLHPRLNAAVIEASRDGILREGLGFDKCQIAVVTRVEWEQEVGGEFDLYDREKVFGVYRTPVDVVLESGNAILNVHDPMCREMKPLCKGSVIYYGRNHEDSFLGEHLREGGSALFPHRNEIVFAWEAHPHSWVSLGPWNSKLPEKAQEDLLAAIAATLCCVPETQWTIAVQQIQGIFAY